MPDLAMRDVQVASITGKTITLRAYERSSLQQEPLTNERGVTFKEIQPEFQNFSLPLSIAYLNLSDNGASGALNVEDPNALGRTHNGTCRNAGSPW
jgi:hypothetical protein